MLNHSWVKSESDLDQISTKSLTSSNQSYQSWYAYNRTWCFNVNEHAFELFFAQVFAKALQDESTVYAFVMINVVKESIVEH